MDMDVSEARYLQNYGKTAYVQMVKEALKDPRFEGVSEDTMLRLISLESAFDPKKRSSVNARGLMQVKPETAAFMQQKGHLPKGKVNLYKPYDNLQSGLAYYKYLLGRFGDEDIALSAYRTGHGAALRGVYNPNYVQGVRRQPLP